MTNIDRYRKTNIDISWINRYQQPLPTYSHQLLGRCSSAGFAADNLAFGSGGALLQKLNRDTFKCAFKCSEPRQQRCCHNGWGLRM